MRFSAFLTDDKSKGCKLADLDRVFLVTNLEEGKSEKDKVGCAGRYV